MGKEKISGGMTETESVFFPEEDAIFSVPKSINERIFSLLGSENEEELEEKIKETSADDIVFLLPRKCSLLSHLVVWQKIRDFCDEKRKNLTCITRDPEGREKLQSLGITVFATLEDREQTPFSKVREYYEPKKIIKRSLDRFFQKKDFESRNVQNDIPHKEIFTKPSLHAFFLFLFFGVVLSLFILHIALPEATVHISPRKKEEEQFLNVKFFSSGKYTEEDLWKENNSIFSYPVEDVFVLEETFSSVTKEYRGELAKGKFILQNFSNESFTLQKNTRVQNMDGIVFLLPHWITLPPAKNGVPIEVEMELTASEKDATGRIQGEKANLPKGQIFFLPGLSEKFREMVKAQNIENTTGGRSEWVFRITEEDMNNAKKRLEILANEKANLELQHFLEEQNEKNGTDWRLLEDGKQRKIEFMSIWIDPLLLGKSQETFPGKIRVRVKNFAYSEKNLLDLVIHHFEKLSPEGMELKKVDKSTIALQLLKIFSDGEIIKVSVTARGVFQYVIEPKSVKGLEFIEKAQNAIQKKEVEESENILMTDFREVESARIEMYPAWVSTLPRLPERIRFVLETEKKE